MVFGNSSLNIMYDHGALLDVRNAGQYALVQALTR